MRRRLARGSVVLVVLAVIGLGNGHVIPLMHTAETLAQVTDPGGGGNGGVGDPGGGGNGGVGDPGGGGNGPTVLPLPSTLPLIGIGLIVLVATRCRKWVKMQGWIDQ